MRTPPRTFTLILFSLCSSLVAAPSEKPNILWIVSEDNSPRIGAYGDPVARSPRIDQLATEGALFEKAYSNAPICAPARTTLLLGVYPTSLGAEHMRCSPPFPEDFTPYPQLLRDAGYYCTNNSKEDYNLAGVGEIWDESSKKAHYKNRPEGSPFFAIFNFTTTHESSLHRDLDQPVKTDPSTVEVPPYFPDIPEVRESIARYYDRIEDMDQQVGEVLDELEKAGLAENTIVFYYADHGGALPRGKRYLHDSGTRVPFIVRVPARWKQQLGIEPGMRIEEKVAFIDFPKTVLALAGAEVPDYLQGRVIFGPDKEPEPEYVFLYRGRVDENLSMQRGITDGRYRYIRNYYPFLPFGVHVEYIYRNPMMPAWRELWEKGELNAVQSRVFEQGFAEELYDTQSDPHEIDNLAVKKEHEKMLTQMRKALHDQLIAIRDTGFRPEAMMLQKSAATGLTPHAVAQDNKAYPIAKLIAAADVQLPSSKEKVADLLKSDLPAQRYWALVACLDDEAVAKKHTKQIEGLLEDRSPTVRLTAAHSLARLGLHDPRPVYEEIFFAAPNPGLRIHATNVLQDTAKEYPPERDFLEEALKAWPIDSDEVAGTWHDRYVGYPARILKMELGEDLD